MLCVRNGMAWQQRIQLLEDFGGKFVLIIATASSERVHADGNITGLPYLWARLVPAPPSSPAGTILQGMRIEPSAPNRWLTMHGVFPVPKGIVAMDVMLGQGERKGTPQNGFRRACEGRRSPLLRHRSRGEGVRDDL